MASEIPAGGGSRFCANCGTPLEANSQFCGNCGQPVAAVAPGGGTPPPQTPQPGAGWAPPVTPPPGAMPPPLSPFAPPVAAARSGGGGRCLIIGGIAVAGLLLLLCCGGLAVFYFAQTATPTPTAAPFPFPPTATPTPAALPTVNIVVTAVPTAPTKTATPAPTATRTAAPTVAPKPSATATRAPTPAALFMDDFSSKQATLDKGWNLDPSANVDYTWAPGKLTISVKKKLWMGSDWPDGTYQDFGAEAEAQPVGSDFADYGLVFRVSGQSGSRDYYAFGLKTDGRYFLYQMVGGSWVDKDAVPPTTSSQVKQGAAKNTIGVVVQGNKISLLINRVLVKSVVDDSISAGGNVGLFAGTVDNASTSVAFTKLTVLPVQRAKSEWGVP